MHTIKSINFDFCFFKFKFSISSPDKKYSSFKLIFSFFFLGISIASMLVGSKLNMTQNLKNLRIFSTFSSILSIFEILFIRALIKLF